MTIKVQCPTCGSQLKVSDAAAGKTGKCPDCGNAVQVPEAIYDAEDVAEDVTDQFNFPDIQASDDEYGLAPEPPAPAPAAEARRPCPMCGEMIAMSAAKCRFCGEVFDPMLKRRTAKRGVSATDAEMQTSDWVICILCAGIGCIAGIVYMIQGKPKGGKMVLVSICAAVFWNVLQVALRAIVK